MPLTDGCHGFCENAQYGMLVADPSGVIIRANAEAGLILGYSSPADLSGKPILSFFGPTSFSTWEELSSRTRETGMVTYSVIPPENGNACESLDVLVSWQHEDDREWYSVCLMAVPETMIDQRVLQHDEQLNFAIRCSGLGIWDIDLRSGEMTVDGRWAEMIGYEPGELMPLTASAFMGYVHPEDQNAFLTLFSGWGMGKHPTGSLKLRLRHKKDNWVWVRSQWQVLRSPDVMPVLRVVGVHQDITNTVKKDTAFCEAQKKIAMLSSVTRHDVLNQVTVIRMLLDIMEMTGEVEPGSDTWKQLEKINEAALAIERQIVFTRDYEDLGSHPPAWQDISGIVDRVTTLSDDFSDITVTCTCRNISINADPMLERVVLELFTNAVRHGGGVTAIMVSFTTTAEGTAVIDISDDGIGIPDDRAKKVFSRGIGIQTHYGLYLAREILSLSGITIQETGTEGTGAVFSLTVPPGNWKISRSSLFSP